MGKARRRVVVRRSRGRLQERGGRRRRDLRRAVHRPSADGNAQRDGVLAERQAVSARLDAERRPHGRSAGELARHRRVEHRPHQRILRRRVRQQGRRRRVDGDSGAAVEEGGRAGDDAHQPRGRALHRPRAHRAWSAARRAGFAQGRTHHRARPLHRRGQRPVRADGRSSIGRQRRVAHLAAAGDALARRRRDHQHAAAHAAAIAGADAGQRDHGAGRHEGGEEARARSARDPPHQFARRQGALRRAASRTGSAAHITERVREGGARSRRRAASSGTSARRGPASGRDRRSAASASPSARTARARSASTA